MDQPAWMNNDLLFKHSIRGEYFYQSAFDRIYTGNEPVIVSGYLQLDNDNPHDKNTVSVWADDEKLGHLSKANAVKFRKKLGNLAVNKAQFNTKIKLSIKEGERIIKIDIKLSDESAKTSVSLPPPKPAKRPVAADEIIYRQPMMPVPEADNKNSNSGLVIWVICGLIILFICALIFS